MNLLQTMYRYIVKNIFEKKFFFPKRKKEESCRQNKRILELSDYTFHPHFLTPSLRQSGIFCGSTWESWHVRIKLHVYIYIDQSEKASRGS